MTSFLLKFLQFLKILIRNKNVGVKCLHKCGHLTPKMGVKCLGVNCPRRKRLGSETTATLIILSKDSPHKHICTACN